MSAEQLAEQIADALRNSIDVVFEPERDLRSDGYFLEVEDDAGTIYTILVTEAAS